jgi:hypothetical protein
MGRTQRGLALGGTATATAGLAAAVLLRRRAARRTGPIIRGVTVDRPPDKVRELLGDPSILSAALGRPVRVEPAGDGIRWQADGVGGRVTVQAAPADWGTEIYVESDRGPDDKVNRTLLRRAKSLVECGQVLSTRDDPADRGPLAEGITDVIRDKLAEGGRP